MNTNILHAQLTVEEVLRNWPRAFMVFRSRKTDCVGCLLQRFCSILDVADTYNLKPEDLVRDLEQCAG